MARRKAGVASRNSFIPRWTSAVACRNSVASWRKAGVACRRLFLPRRNPGALPIDRLGLRRGQITSLLRLLNVGTSLLLPPRLTTMNPEEAEPYFISTFTTAERKFLFAHPQFLSAMSASTDSVDDMAKLNRLGVKLILSGEYQPPQPSFRHRQSA